jgi:hypothetical protein
MLSVKAIRKMTKDARKEWLAGEGRLNLAAISDAIKSAAQKGEIEVSITEIWERLGLWQQEEIEKSLEDEGYYTFRRELPGAWRDAPQGMGTLVTWDDDG